MRQKLETEKKTRSLSQKKKGAEATERVPSVDDMKAGFRRAMFFCKGSIITGANHFWQMTILAPCLLRGIYFNGWPLAGVRAHECPKKDQGTEKL
eukprot:6371262-Amphidinium_carterae.2